MPTEKLRAELTRAVKRIGIAETLNECIYDGMITVNFGTLVDRLEALAADSPWVPVPEGGWTAETLPSTYGPRWIITVDVVITNRADLKLWRNPKDIDPEWWQYVDAWMYVDPPTDIAARKARAEGGGGDGDLRSLHWAAGANNDPDD